MAREITQRERRNESGKIMRALDRGESFVVTRRGRPCRSAGPVSKRQLVASEVVAAAFADAQAIDFARFRSDVDAPVDQDAQPRA